MVEQVACAHKSNRYTKRFSSYDKLVTMLNATIGGFSYLRTLEINMATSALLVGRVIHAPFG